MLSNLTECSSATDARDFGMWLPIVDIFLDVYAAANLIALNFALVLGTILSAAIAPVLITLVFNFYQLSTSSSSGNIIVLLFNRISTVSSETAAS